LWPKIHYTPGGVGINAKAQVIDLHQRPIPRLFAAGEVSGGIHGASRLGSCSLTECIVFGRIAGQQAAAVKPDNFD
jgi:succinate dehydrogenase/fumarate reductase flavoprotein subunit